MTDAARLGGWVILTSLIFALMLTLMPLPVGVALYRPEWVALVLIYWCLALPERVGLGAAWGMGLLLDVVTGALLGQHALSLTVVAHIAVRLHRRIRQFPLWQQALSVLWLIGIHQLLLLWVKGISGLAPATWRYWLPSIISMLLWPCVFVILRQLRRRYVTVDT